jgi:hypothetical protein
MLAACPLKGGKRLVAAHNPNVPLRRAPCSAVGVDAGLSLNLLFAAMMRALIQINHMTSTDAVIAMGARVALWHHLSPFPSLP